MSQAPSWNRRTRTAARRTALARGLGSLLTGVALVVLGVQVLPASAAGAAGPAVARPRASASPAAHVAPAPRVLRRLHLARPSASERPARSLGAGARRDAATATRALDSALAARPRATRERSAGDPLAGEGGSIECIEGSTVQLDVAMAYGTSGTVDVDPNDSSLGADSVCTLTGVVPAGWSAFFAPYSVNAVPNSDGTAGVEGSLTLGSWYDGFNNSCYGAEFNAAAGMTFVNDGTITQESFNGAPYDQPSCGYPDPNVDLANFVQEPGATFSVPTGTSWDFDYDNATTPGTFTNYGSLSVPASSMLEVANGNCTKGIDYVSEPASSVTVATSGTFQVSCGGIDVEGGSVTGGPIVAGGTHLSIVFGSSVPAGSAGTIEVPGGAETLTGTLATGWTVDLENGGTMTAAPGSGVDGTLQFTGSTLSDSGAFTNDGTVDAFGGGTITVPDLVNSGLLEATAYNSTDADSLNLLYDNASTPGVLDNTGTIHVDAKQTLYVGPEDCQTGTDLVMQGGTIDPAGAFVLRCGELDLDGGSVSSAGPVQVSPIGSTLVDFDTGLDAGGGGSTDTVEFESSGPTAEGTIPSGWTTVLGGHPVAFAPGSVNDGTMDATDYGAGITDTGTFTNAGTMTVESGDAATIVTPDFENQGTVQMLGTSTGSSSLGFTYDASSGAGLIDNIGTIDAQGGQLTVGTEDCKSGEDLLDGAGSSLAASASTADLDVECGELDLDGGSIAAGGPVQVSPIGTVLVDFDSGLGAGTISGGDAVELEGTSFTVEGAIPSGWTLDDAGHPVTTLTGTSNAGTVEFSDYGAGINDTGSFTNSGTMTVESGDAATIDVQSLANPGTIQELGTSTGSTSLDFTYDSSGGAGTIDNTGTIDAQGGQLTVGTESCQHGEDLVDSGSAASLAASATTAALYVQCGELDLDGGSIAAGGPVQVDPVGTVLVDFDSGLGAGTGGTADTVEVEGSGTTLEGAIPSGWTLDDAGHTMTTLAGTSNAGTVEFSDYGAGINDTGSFTNSGTMTVESGDAATIDVQSLANPGTIQELGTSTGSTSLDFTYDSSGGAGTIDNTGTIDAQGGQLTVGTESCQHGEDLVDGVGSSLAASATTAALYVQCGELDLDGGSIAAGGPVQVDPVGTVLVDFDSGLGAGTGGTADTVEVEGSGTTLEGAIPSGWTLDDAGHTMTTLAGTSNAGAIQLSAYGSGLAGSPGTFSNTGTITVTNSASLFTSAATTLDNSGTVTVTANNSLDGSQTSLDNTGSVVLGQNAQLEPQLGYTQGASGSLGVTVNGGNAAEVSSSSGPASLAGTLAITTTSTLPSEGSTLTVVQSSGPLTGTFSAVTGRYPGAVGYLPAYTSTRAQLDVLYTQSIAFTSTAPADAVYDGTGYAVTTAGGGSGNLVTLSIPVADAAVCSLTGSTVSFTGVGTCEVDANQAGSSSYLPALQASQSFAVAQAPQAVAITSTAPTDAVVGGPGYAVTTAGGGSGNPVTLSIATADAAVCSLAGSTVSFKGVGTCEVDANEAGDADYLAAPEQPQSFSVGQGSQAITFTSTAPAHAVVGGTGYAVTTKGGGSGKPVTLSIATADAAVCSLAGSTVSFTGVGTCEVDANEAGDADYLAAPEQTQSFSVSKGTSVITITSHAPSGPVIGGGYVPTATASSGDTVAITLGATSAGCTLSGGSVHFTADGTCVIDFNDPGDASYLAAAQVSQSLVIGKRSLTLKASASPTSARSSTSIRLTATLSVKTSGTVAFTEGTKTLCTATISKGVASCKVSVSLKKGTYTVKASYGGNATYLAATATTKLTVT